MRTADYKNYRGDTVECVTIQVRHILDAGELATLWIGARRYDSDATVESVREDAEKVSERDVLKAVREMLRCDGANHSMYRVSDDGLHEHSQAASKAFDQRFFNSRT